MGFRQALDPATLGRYASAGTFTADQRFNGKVGIGVAPSYPLHGVNAGSGTTFRFDTALLGGVIQHTADLSGATGDLLDTINRGTGDNIWLVHMGGHPTSGDVGGTGGNAALNGLIPYHIDIDPLTGTTGRDGSVVNTRQGMSLFRGESQATANTQPAWLLTHHGAGYAMYLANQVNTSGQVQGGGGGFQIDEYSGTNSILIKRFIAPGAQKSMLHLKSHVSGASAASAHSIIEGLDDADVTRSKLDTSGRLRLFDTAGTTKVDIKGSDGSAAFQAISGTALTLTSGFSAGLISTVNVTGTADTTTAFYIQSANQATFGVRASGKLLWGAAGSFGSAGDTNLYRAVTNSVTRIKTDNSLHAVGPVITSKNAAPADADLSAGEMALWFDSTNGAAKLMVKSKQADGTVRTGSVALA